MWIVVGLGNPGSRYEGTPHNLGFEVVRLLARRHGLKFSASRIVRAEAAIGDIAGHRVGLLMPITYMNISGEATRPFAEYYKVPAAQVLPISDDITIPWGKIRVRPGGSHGGHNGLRSLIQHHATDQFPRIRIGCAPENWRGTLADYVLSKLGGDAAQLAQHMVEIGADVVEGILRDGVETTQNKFNGYDAMKQR